MRPEKSSLFLDEVGELPHEIQVTLLRVLQEREFERVGGERPIPVNVRVIAATNRNLQSAIEESTFRSDLYYRLNVFPLAVPPLRERPEDIPLPIEYFTYRFARRAGKTITGISKSAMSILRSYDWPGNVRELQNIVERAVIVSDSATLHIRDKWFSRRHSSAPFTTHHQGLATQERDTIEAALIECKGRVAGPFGAASRLSIPSSTLESKIKVLNIDKRQFKPQ